MYWGSLIVAGLFEMIGVLMINIYHQRKSWGALALLILSFSLSFALLSFSMKVLPMGTAYAVWTGIGAAGSAVIGIIWFKERANAIRILMIATIITATIGLKLIAS
ncbi:DMT family transporter [Piscibacillus halophilus]|uniref:Paired small multidrug resistance pump n=1 Tax=Piscibacillus halophilus TaxID=571933 RepID=A0A1H9FSZ7_9BACI|nr:multidrug efflux SMR transporter [Piscibacillus halophilus]SEQ41051.1 paired small multidrug resistance pump [Piscibacillus halophilus]